MLMTDSDIQQALKDKTLEIANISEDSFKSLAYVARLGKRALIGGQNKEINLNNDNSIILKAGDFVLFNTEESFKLSDKIAGHIGMSSYYARKGLILLAGMHIDPEWDGHLVLGAYNASPREIVLDYLSNLIVIEFHQLTKAPNITAKKNPEQRKGLLPKMDKDFLRTLETQSLSELGKEIRELTISVSGLDKDTKALKWVMGTSIAVMTLGFAFIGMMIALKDNF